MHQTSLLAQTARTHSLACRNGIRQNTREMREKERMQARRQDLVEEMIKRDPNYRPPADYRCVWFSKS